MHARYFRHILLALYTTVSIFGTAFAQEETETGEVAEDPHAIKGPQFTAIALSDLPYKNIYYRAGEEEFKEIEFRKGRRSYPCPLLPGGTVLELFTTTDDPENPFRVIGRAPRVSGTLKMLYFILETTDPKANPLPLTLYGLDDSETGFPESSFRFFSFVNAPLKIGFAENKFALKPRESKIEKIELPAEGAFTPFIVANAKGDILGATRIFGHATNREMVLIFPPKKGKRRLDIRFFSD